LYLPIVPISDKRYPGPLALIFVIAFLAQLCLADSAKVEAKPPPVPKWSVDGQVVPLGESRTVSIAPHEGVSVQSFEPGVVEVEALGGGKFRLTGKSWARTNLLATTSSGVQIPELPVSVKPWSARWGEGPGTLTFYGPVTAKRVERSLDRWLSARTMIGAEISLEKLESKEEASWNYRVRAVGQGAIPVDSKIAIKVVEQPRQGFRPAEVVVLSNHPERIVSDGVLFERQVSDAPFRFMWHHRNQPGDPDRYLVLQLTNTAPVERRVRLLWFGYGPSPDEIHVGHTAALDYSVAGATGMGEEMVLPANGTRTMEIRRVKPGQTMSGMAYLADLSNITAPIGIRVLATSTLTLPETPASSRDPGRTASGVFPAEIATEYSHLVGGPYTYLEFGGEPYEKDVTGGHPSYGNFGTVYRASLVLSNPTSVAQEVRIGFASGGGAARGVLALDGELYDLPMGVTGEGLPVRTYRLEAGETRQVDVELFPQAGSNYPVRVVVSSPYDRRAEQKIPPLRPFNPSIP